MWQMIKDLKKVWQIVNYPQINTPVQGVQLHENTQWNMAPCEPEFKEILKLLMQSFKKITIVCGLHKKEEK